MYEIKDFDAVRAADRPERPIEARMFRLGGEVFVMRDSVRPDALTPLDIAMRDPKFDNNTCGVCEQPRIAHRAGAGGKLITGNCDGFAPKMIDPGPTLQDRIQAFDTVFVSLTEPDDNAHARYRALREREYDPILLPDLIKVIEWMTEEQTGRRPTGSPSVSSDGRKPTGTTLTEDSSSLDILAESPV